MRTRYVYRVKALVNRDGKELPIVASWQKVEGVTVRDAVAFILACVPELTHANLLDLQFVYHR